MGELVAAVVVVVMGTWAGDGAWVGKAFIDTIPYDLSECQATVVIIFLWCPFPGLFRSSGQRELYGCSAACDRLFAAKPFSNISSPDTRSQQRGGVAQVAPSTLRPVSR